MTVNRINRGKQFEEIIKKSFEKVPDTSVVRLHDQTNGYLGSRNHCDFIVYHKPLEYHIECKSVHGNTFPLNNITDNQWHGLLEKSKIEGVVAGIICWFVDKDVTLFIDITFLYALKTQGYKSIRYDSKLDSYPPNYADETELFVLEGKKKKVFFDYDMNKFFKDIDNTEESVMICKYYHQDIKQCFAQKNAPIVECCGYRHKCEVSR